MNELQHTQAGIAADLLAQGRLAAYCSLLATAGALFGLIISHHTPGIVAIAMAVAALLGLVQLYLAARTDFDRALFERLARGLHPETMDSILVDLRLATRPTANRNLAERTSGSRRLLRLQCAVTLLQYLLIIGGVLLA